MCTGSVWNRQSVEHSSSSLIERFFTSPCRSAGNGLHMYGIVTLISRVSQPQERPFSSCAPSIIDHPHPLCARSGSRVQIWGAPCGWSRQIAQDATVVTCQLSASGKVLAGGPVRVGRPDPHFGLSRFQFRTWCFPAFASATSAVQGPAPLLTSLKVSASSHHKRRHRVFSGSLIVKWSGACVGVGGRCWTVRTAQPPSSVDETTRCCGKAGVKFLSEEAAVGNLRDVIGSPGGESVADHRPIRLPAPPCFCRFFNARDAGAAGGPTDLSDQDDCSEKFQVSDNGDHDPLSSPGSETRQSLSHVLDRRQSAMPRRCVKSKPPHRDKTSKAKKERP